jgi:membrane-bound ClpP family serine protease
MDWVTVIGFVIFGIILIVIEIIFVPGTTIVGIGGFVCVAYGIYVSFSNFGDTIGFTVLTVSGIVSVGILVYALKSKAWEQFSLKNTINSRVNEKLQNQLEIGDVGELISSLKPVGKAVFKEIEFEVRSMGQYLREKQNVRVVKISNHKIFVEPINES